MMTTAAHCFSVGTYVTYHGDGGFQVTRRSFDPFHDVETFDLSGAPYTADVYFGTAFRAVVGVRNWSSMHVGDQVAKYGQTTGFTVGTIRDVTTCGASGCDPESKFVG